MELDHEFTVPVPMDLAWQALLDLERVVPCVPGARLDSIDGDEFTGRLKVRLGAMTITYRGEARIAVADESTRTVTIEGTAREARGSGAASATVQAQLLDEGDRTRVTVHTKLTVTGRPAPFGRGLLSEVAGKLIDRFSAALAQELQSTKPAAAEVEDGQAGESAPAAPADGVFETAPAAPADGVFETAPEARSGPEDSAKSAPVAPRKAGRSEQALNLLHVAGPSVVKRAAPLAALLLTVLAIRHLFRRRRGRHHRG